MSDTPTPSHPPRVWVVESTDKLRPLIANYALWKSRYKIPIEYLSVQERDYDVRTARAEAFEDAALYFDFIYEGCGGKKPYVLERDVNELRRQAAEARKAGE